MLYRSLLLMLVLLFFAACVVMVLTRAVRTDAPLLNCFMQSSLVSDAKSFCPWVLTIIQTASTLFRCAAYVRRLMLLFQLGALVSVMLNAVYRSPA